MEKLDRDIILSIGNSILAESDVVAMHGTSISNAKSIMETGFNYHRTSMVVAPNDAVSLCTYGWKDNEPGDAANVIISAPKSFFKAFLGFDDEKYKEWINTSAKDNKELLLTTLCDVQLPSQNSMVFNSHLPREFIVGTFIYTDNENYLSFLGNMEEGLDHLTYIDNPYYYEHLTEEDKIKFVEEMRKKVFGQGGPKQGGK